MWDDAKQLNAAAAGLALIAIGALAWGALAWAIRQPVFEFREVVVTAPLERASADERILKFVAQKAGLGPFVDCTFQAAFAHIAAAAFDDVKVQIGNDLRQARQVLVKQLLLQGHGRGGDDDGFLQQLRSHDRGQAISHGLAGARAGFKLREIVALTALVVR